MTKLLKYLSIGSSMIILVLTSCTERIDIELDSTYTRLVVYGSVTTDSLHHQVDLSTSSDYFTNLSTPRVSGARVEIRFEEDTVLFEELDSVPGLYQAREAFRGVPGTTYNLIIKGIDINSDGEEELYEASSTMPGGFTLDSVRLEYFTSYFVSGYQILMYALDPPTRDWYGLRYFRNGQVINDTLGEYSVQADDFYNGGYLFYDVPVGFFRDEDPESMLIPGDTVTLELQSIEEEYYNFVLDAQLEILGYIPLFSGPPANVPSNISNDAKGIFTAYSLRRASVIVPSGLN